MARAAGGPMPRGADKGLSSPKEVGRVLFGAMGLPPPSSCKAGASGNLSTSKEVLQVRIIQQEGSERSE